MYLLLTIVLVFKNGCNLFGQTTREKEKNFSSMYLIFYAVWIFSLEHFQLLSSEVKLVGEQLPIFVLSLVGNFIQDGV